MLTHQHQNSDLRRVDSLDRSPSNPSGHASCALTTHPDEEHITPIMITILIKKFPRLTSTLPALTLALLASACETVSIDKHGRLPEQAIPTFARFEGEYTGNYFRQPGKDAARGLHPLTIRVALVDRAPTIEASYDLSGRADCGSVVGSLFKLVAWNKEGTEFRGSFHFVPGQTCASRIEGRVMDFALRLDSDGEMPLHTQIVEKRNRVARNGRAPGYVTEETKLVGRFLKN